MGHTCDWRAEPKGKGISVSPMIWDDYYLCKIMIPIIK